ncbi:MAG TPA: ABC transporter permease [Bryobacteraceae bacterium]|nr:ABC transporter permease [Bryobacteraceae bacterium]
MNDLQYAARTLSKTPGFTLVAAGLLAAGIGANAVIFSAIDAVLLRRLPVRHPEELVRLVQRTPQLGTRSYFPYEMYAAIRDHSTTLTQPFGEEEWRVAMNQPAPAEQVRVTITTPEYFEALGVPARYGRALTAADAVETPGEIPAVLSYGFWTRRFHADPNAVGGAIVLNGHRFTIVGVMPREFNGTSLDTSPDVRLPLRASELVGPQDYRSSTTHKIEWSLDLAARLRPGVTRAQALEETRALWRSTVEAIYKGSPDGVGRLDSELRRGVDLDAIDRGVSILRDKYGAALKLLITLVGVLLLIVCANVAGLLLARGAARRLELAVRLAVGATRGRLVRQVLCESGLLAAFGGVGGVTLAFLVTPVLVHALPPMRDLGTGKLTLSIPIAPDARVLLFSLGISALTVFLAGMAPALAASRASLDSILRGARSAGGWRGRQALLIVQVALCTPLLASAGLLLRTFERLRAVGTGFDQDHLVTFTTDPSLASYTPEQTRNLRQALLDRVKELPGVIDAAMATRPLMRGSGVKMSIAPAGQQVRDDDFLNTSINNVTVEYFDTMGLRVVAGRVFTPGELHASKPSKVVVNEAFVRRFFSGVSPIGRHFGSGWHTLAQAQFEIVGVVSDAKYRSLREPMTPTFYGGFTEGDGTQPLNLQVRTRGRPDSIIQPVVRILAALDPALPFTEIGTMAEEIDASTAGERLTATLASIFGALAAGLAAIGIYGLLAYSVVRRRREIGIRMAIGARPADIAGMIGRQTLTIVASGVAIGLVGALAAGAAIRALLFDVAPQDPIALAGAAAFLAIVAAIAGTIPATNAARISPSTALREE